MKINRINHSQSFGKLTITADKAKCCSATRDLYTTAVPYYLFDYIDKLSGNIPVRIHFKKDKSAAGGINVICSIKEKPVICGSPFVFDIVLERLKKELLCYKGIKNPADKYFA